MDLLEKLGSKGEGSKEVKSNVNASSNGVAQTDRGDDLIAKMGKAEVSVETKPEPEAKVTESASKEEPAAGETASTSSWTVESALKEVKKLREENKSVRLKYEEQVEKLKADVEAKVSAIEEKYKPTLDAARELEEVKAKEADKKRDVVDKLAHREALLAETKAEKERLQAKYEAELAEARVKLSAYEAEKQAENEVYKKRVDEELNTIPQKFRTHAELLVKGAGDMRDALLVLSEAKIQGLFEDKTVVVNHSVPGARDGARVTSEQMQSKAREEYDRMTPSQKIGAALKAIRSGEKNSAFGGRK